MIRIYQTVCFFVMWFLILTLSPAMAAGNNTASIAPAPPAPDHLPRNVQVLRPLVATPPVIPAPAADGLPAYQPNQVLVKFKKGAADALIRNRTQTDARIKKRKHFKSLSRRHGQAYFLLTSETESADALRQRLLRDPMVEAVSFNYVMTIEGTIPGDPGFSKQWPLHNTGQVFRSDTPAGLPDADIDAPQAWDFHTGSDAVVVAVLDSGIDYDHPDLIGNLWTNAAEDGGVPGIDDDANGYIDDIYGIDTGQGDTDPIGFHWHGTHVAGTIAAEGDNDLGIAGVNWCGNVLTVKVSASDGLIYTASLIEAFEYIADLKARGVNIVAANASFGGATYDTITRDGVAMLAAEGIILVASAGNSGVDTDFSAHYPSGYDLGNIISVAATDSNDNLADFSNFGWGSTDLGAPGVSVLSTYAQIHYTPSLGDAFFDDMESGDALWSATGPWAVTQAPDGPNPVWSDSPGGNYLANSNTGIVSESIDLSLEQSLRAPFHLGFRCLYELEENVDFLDIAFYAPPRPSTWQRTQAQALEGTWAWSDSPGGNYPANAHSWLASPVVDLSAADSGAIVSFANTGRLEQDNDQMRIYFSADGGASWSWVAYITGDYSDNWYGWYVTIAPEFRTSGFRFAFVMDTNKSVSHDGYTVDDVAVQDDAHTIVGGNPIFHDGFESADPLWEQPQFADWEFISSVTGNSGGVWSDFNIIIEDWFIWDQFRVAFTMDTDGANHFDGVYLDDIGVGIPTVNAHTYAYANGTSMAAPHVSGAVALMAAYHPFESMAGRVHRILAGAENVPSLDGKTATGGRLNLLNSLLAPGLCEADISGGADADVDGADLADLAAEFNVLDCGTTGTCHMDLDGNGRVDAVDLGIFAADFGSSDCP